LKIFQDRTRVSKHGAFFAFHVLSHVRIFPKFIFRDTLISDDGERETERGKHFENISQARRYAQRTIYISYITYANFLKLASYDSLISKDDKEKVKKETKCHDAGSNARAIERWGI